MLVRLHLAEGAGDVPSASITNVERSMPMNVLPYMERSFQTS